MTTETDLIIAQFPSNLEGKAALRSLARVFKEMCYEPEADAWLAGKKWMLILMVSQARKGWWTLTARPCVETDDF